MGRETPQLFTNVVTVCYRTFVTSTEICTHPGNLALRFCYSHPTTPKIWVFRVLLKDSFKFFKKGVKGTPARTLTPLKWSDNYAKVSVAARWVCFPGLSELAASSYWYSAVPICYKRLSCICHAVTARMIKWRSLGLNGTKNLVAEWSDP